MNDIVHYRGQITTYLRAMGSTAPQDVGSGEIPLAADAQPLQQRELPFL